MSHNMGPCAGKSGTAVKGENFHLNLYSSQHSNVELFNVVIILLVCLF